MTGISTGALIAPFAFLGSSYDDTLRYLYTGITGKDIFIYEQFAHCFVAGVDRRY